MTEVTLRPHRWWLDTALVTLSAAVLYLLLQQRRVYGLDAYYLVQYLTQGVEHPLHITYLRLVALARPVLEPLGLSLFQVMATCSAVGTALGILCVHRAALGFGLSRAAALWTTGLCAVTPAIVFFATVVEIHGVFFGFAGLAWLVLAGLVASPGYTRAALLGLATAAANSVHATGLLLPGLMIPVLWSARWSQLGARRSLGLGVATGVTHLAAMAAFTALFKPGAFGHQTDYLLEFLSRERTLVEVPLTLWREWLWPFFAISFTSALALFRRPTRPLAIAMWIPLVGYLAVTLVLMPPDTTERGAYILPFVFPAALLTVEAFPRPAIVAATILGLGLAVYEVADHDRPVGVDEAYVAGLEAVAERTPPMLICRGFEEVNTILRSAPDIPCVGLYTLAARWGHDYELFCREFDLAIENVEHQNRTVFITAAAFRMLAEARDPIFGRFFREHLTVRYHVTPVHEGAFEAYRLERIR